MNKISVIISHEYRTRVRSKWFIISTLLGPLGLAVLLAVPILVTMLAGDGAEGKTAIVDRTSSIGAAVVMSDTSSYVDASDRSEEDLAADVRDEKLQAYVIVPSDILDGGEMIMYSRGGSGLGFEKGVERDFRPAVVKARLQRVGTDTSVIELVERGVAFSSLKITKEGDIEKDSSKASAVIGYVAGFAIYILIFLYGTMVMRGVIEEKTNRIVEIIASSAKPFEIMMGKIVGIGLVGLTQMVAWLVLGIGVIFILGTVLSGTVDPQSVTMHSEQMTEAMQGMGGAAPMTTTNPLDDLCIPDINIGSIVLFIFYFLAGYFIYATMFAAVGSAVDQESDAQQLTIPITIPIIVTIMFIGNIVAAPNSPLAVSLSLFPLFTPILMTVRVAATDVPWWQVGLSVVLTTGTFFGAVWAAARIYRIGILSYGKKPTIKDLIKWIR